MVSFFNAMFPLLPLLLASSVSALVVPAQRDVAFEPVRDAVVALAGESGSSDIPREGSVQPNNLVAVTQPTPTQPVIANAQVLVAGDEQEGYWQVYTTSTWIAAPDQSSSAVQSSSSSTSAEPIGAIVSGWYGQPVSPDPSTSAASVSSSLGSLLSPGPTVAPEPLPTPQPPTPQPLTGGYLPGKHVFAHFMVGIVSTYKHDDWVADMQLAKDKGITGFALNIGVDPYTQEQLDLAYAAAEVVGDFDLFISFDFNWYAVSDTAGVATMMKRYVDKPAQLLVDGKPFVSSFIGDGFNWKACADMIGREIYAIPFFQPNAESANDAGVAGLFSWAAWPGQLDNQPLKANMTLNRDDAYLEVLNPAQKQYMAPISPWFFTHFGPEVPYSKNWLFYSEALWKTRWDQVLELGQRGVNLVEIVTWNDYGEAHHIGPYNTPHTDDGASKWAEGLDHSAMLDFSVPYIEAFKQGKREPVITKETLFYWHRPHLKDVQCDSTDNCGSKPKGWEYVEDVLFVSTMTTNGGTVTVNSGDKAAYTQTVEAGVQTFQVPMEVGQQSFQLSTNAGVSVQGASNVSVTNTCWNGIYNFNFHSGIVA